MGYIQQGIAYAITIKGFAPIDPSDIGSVTKAAGEVESALELAREIGPATCKSKVVSRRVDDASATPQSGDDAAPAPQESESDPSYGGTEPEPDEDPIEIPPGLRRTEPKAAE